MILIIVSSKSPNPFLFECIEALYKIQIKEDLLKYKICVIDSDSDDVSNYEKINAHYPDVEIHYAKNKNYEYGAWKYGLELYPNYDIYFTIHDSMIITSQIDLQCVNNKVALIWHNNTGYISHITIKEKGIENLKLSNLNYEQLIDTNFTLAYGSMFIVSNDVMKDIFNTLTIPPIDKDGSCFYERNFGLYFILKNINTFDIASCMIKIHGCRY